MRQANGSSMLGRDRRDGPDILIFWVLIARFAIWTLQRAELVLA